MDSAEEMLRCFLAAEDDCQAGRVLERLIQEHADPVITAVVRRKMEVALDLGRRWTRAAARGEGGAAERRSLRPNTTVELDAEDVHASSVLYLLERLMALRGAPEAPSIQDFRAYVGRLALHAFAQHLRRRYPERHRLRRKLWYLAQDRTPVSGFALWQGRRPAEQLFGFRAWEGQPLDLTRNYRRWQEDSREFRVVALRGPDPGSLPFPDLVAQILNWVGGPMDIDHLVAGLMELLDLRELERIDG